MRKYKIGDTAYIMKKDHIHEVKIIGESIVNENTERYLIIDGEGFKMWLYDNYIFSSITALINSLKETIIR